MSVGIEPTIDMNNELFSAEKQQPGLKDEKREIEEREVEEE